MNTEHILEAIKDAEQHYWTRNNQTIPEVMLDRFFWQALGKAKSWVAHREQWEDSSLSIRGCVFLGGILEYPYHEGGQLSWTTKEKWRYEMHRFIDHLASGADAESFFASLTNK